MTRTLTMFAVVAAAALAGCDQSDHTIQGGGPEDPMANQATPTDIKLPPSIVASHKYRCGDNSIVSIDWLSDGKVNSARVTPEGASGVNVTQAEAEGDYTAEGTTLKGDPEASEVTFNGKSCKK